jgi:RNA polymerase sigma factor (sigma-70 family)
LRYGPESTAGRLLAGDRETVSEAVRWISRVLGSPSFWSLRRDWTDMVQEVLGRVLGSLKDGRFDPERDFRTYVQGVARFTAFTALSRRTPEVPVNEDGPELPDEPAGGSAEDRLTAEQLTRYVLDRASESCRGLLVAYFMEQRSYSEIAEETGQPVGTVKSRLFRCLDAARVAVGGRGASRDEQK